MRSYNLVASADALAIPSAKDGSQMPASCVIAYLTLTPQPVPIISGDKLHHLIGFAALSLPASILYRQALLWLLPGIIAFGGAIELAHPYINRRGEWGDIWADIAGVLSEVIIGLIIRQMFLFF